MNMRRWPYRSPSLPNIGIEIENAIAGAMLTQAIKLVRA